MTPEHVATQLVAAHGPVCAALATLVHATETALGAYSRMLNLRIEPLLALQRVCINSWGGVQGIAPHQVDCALADLRSLQPLVRDDDEPCPSHLHITPARTEAECLHSGW